MREDGNYLFRVFILNNCVFCADVSGSSEMLTAKRIKGLGINPVIPLIREFEL